MTWRLLYVRSGREYAVLAELVARKLDGYVPTETVWKGPAHRRAPHKRPFLPSGYVFANLDEPAFAIARQLPDVTGALRILCATGEETYAMDRHIGDMIGVFIESIRVREREGEFDHTRRKGEGLSVGQRVKVTVGAWMGHLATIKALKGKHAVGIQVDGFAAPVDIDAAKLEAA
jgi:transcription antitermination factor NusG